MSKIETSSTESSVSTAENKPIEISGTLTTDEEEIRIDVPVIDIPFGGKTEGKDFIRVKNPLGMRYRISSGYGQRFDPLDGESRFHKGIDFEVPVGRDVRASEPGEVLTADFKDDGAGRRVVILHKRDDGLKFCTAYFHLSEIKVKRGEYATIETVVGLSGGSPEDPQAGRSTGPHLHFETRTWPDYTPIEPVIKYI